MRWPLVYVSTITTLVIAVKPVIKINAIVSADKLNNNQIDKVIAESTLFAQCLSLLDYAKPKYHAFYNYNVRNQHDLVFFYFIKYKVLDEFVKEKLNQTESEQKETIRKLDEVLDRMIAEDVDEILVEGLKDPEIEKE